MDRQVIERALRDINSIFSDLLIDTNFISSDLTTSWPGYKPGIFNQLAYAAEYQRLIDDRQYSFLLGDKSFFQFFFKLKDGEVVSAKIGYYPPPIRLSNALDDLLEAAEISGVDILEEFYIGAESWMDRGVNVVNTSHIRIDYDPSVTSHSPCHIQFGGMNEFRIPSKSLINPFVFFEWVCRSIEIENLNKAEDKAAYKATSSYHLKRSLEVDGVERDLPHLIANS